MPDEAIDPDDPLPYEFEAEISTHLLGTLTYTVVYLDRAIAVQLPLKEHPRLRTSGELRDIPFRGAWQPSRGRWYLMLNKQILRDGGFDVGDRVTCRFKVEPQDALDVPQSLERALAKNAKARAAWGRLTAGFKRGLCHRVSSAKTDSTTTKRLAEVIDHLCGRKMLPGLAGRDRKSKRRATKSPGA